MKMPYGVDPELLRSAHVASGSSLDLAAWVAQLPPGWLRELQRVPQACAADLKGAGARPLADCSRALQLGLQERLDAAAQHAVLANNLLEDAQWTAAQAAAQESLNGSRRACLASLGEAPSADVQEEGPRLLRLAGLDLIPPQLRQRLHPEVADYAGTALWVQAAAAAQVQARAWIAAGSRSLLHPEAAGADGDVLTLDLRDVACPLNYARIRAALQQHPQGLSFILHPDAQATVLASLRADGFAVHATADHEEVGAWRIYGQAP